MEELFTNPSNVSMDAFLSRMVDLGITVGSMAMPAGTYIIDNAEKQNDHLYNDRRRA